MSAADRRFIELNATLDKIGNGVAFAQRFKLSFQGDHILLSMAIGQCGPRYLLSPARLEEMATPEEKKAYPGVLRFGNCWVRFECDDAPLSSPPWPILTGSHVYGEPREKSDIDLILPVQTREHTQQMLAELAGHDTGRLSIIPASPDRYNVWRIGTEALALLKSGIGGETGFDINRDYACNFLFNLAAMKNVSNWEGST